MNDNAQRILLSTHTTPNGETETLLFLQGTPIFRRTGKLTTADREGIKRQMGQYFRELRPPVVLARWDGDAKLYHEIKSR